MLVGQVKALVGQSNYVKIKEELAKYYQAEQPQVRRQHLNKMLGLIAKWMKANAKSTTSGNLTRMQRLQVLRSEIQQELTVPALTGVGKQAAAPGAPLGVEAATIGPAPRKAVPAVAEGPYQPPWRPGLGMPRRRRARGRGGSYGRPWQAVAAVAPINRGRPAVGRGAAKQPARAGDGERPRWRSTQRRPTETAIPAEGEPLLPPQADAITKKGCAS